jgi:hypothetical protein
MANNIHNATEDESRELAEQSREQDWNGKSFLRNLFLGDLRIDWIDPFPETKLSDEYWVFHHRFERFLKGVDSSRIDEEGQYGDDVLKGLADLGCFGMKIDKKYGGLGFNQVEYGKALEMASGYDGNIVALVSAHQSIGLPQPLKLFGTPEQKQTYLPRCAKGAVTAFALTEPDVGSDPARLATMAERTPEGDFILNGVKLWITNGTIAELMVVMARHPDTKRISAFIVETSDPGVTIDHRCHFMGLRALENGVIRFTNVRVPKENIIHKEGAGLKVALITLNTGRLSLPVACVGGAKRSLTWIREWSNQRVQWGKPIGHHEAITHMIANIAAQTYAMESLCNLANELSMREGYDIRLEAAVAKEWVSTRGWDRMDDVLQIRGGRGYERQSSLQNRGETDFPIERMFRDSRINRIFEGSSEVMHLFMAREMVDQHLKVAGALLEKKATLGDKLKALPRVAAFYAGWYPKLYWGFHKWGSYSKFGSMASHLRYAERTCRRLARNVFHGMVWYQASLERKQAFLFRTVDIAMELAVICATVVRTQRLVESGAAHQEHAVELANSFCTQARFFIDQRFKELWSNDDDGMYAVGRHMLDGKFDWLESASEEIAEAVEIDAEQAAK